MSERRKVRSALTDAEIRIDYVLSALGEAEYQLESYDFLVEANPGLLDRIDAWKRELSEISFQLFDTDVHS